MLLLWMALLTVSCAQGAQVYMQFNGQGYSYNTDGDRLDRSVVAPSFVASSLDAFGPLNFVQQALRTRHHPLPRISYNAQDNLAEATSLLSSGYQAAPTNQLKPLQRHQNFDFSTDQMSHAQHTDEAGNVLGKYSYYDEAGYHELSYKAGAGIGFVVMGGNLAKASAAEPHSEIGIGIGNGIHTNALTSLPELHKYRGYT
ncbi:uncharacterized protein LOC6544085 [Drosophila erecta]|uniref:Uncharacterized protein n=1 Tax=Drosophila erecta TaxID=7220 RepID=B3NDF4_DROER|nr:uncharacterized protein LOC6544085 [Drosophila erecta]EDV52016.1 uncharacterized protein Dere_GG15840 [Drosophila erecta]